MTARTFFLSIAMLLLGAGLAFADADTWQTAAPLDPNWETTAQPLAPSDMAVVPQATRAQALKKLAKDPFVALTPAAVARLLPGQALPADAALKPYLVRGVALDETQGGFSVETNNGLVWVMFNCLSATPPPPSHRALVLFLASPPQQVFITASALQ